MAAGRKLAESNKKAREALKREVEHEVDPKTESWIPNIDFQTVLSIVGIAIALFGLFREVSRAKPPVTLTPTPTPTPTPIENNRIEGME